MSQPTEKQINRLFAENKRTKDALIALNKELDALAAAIHELADKQIEVKELEGVVKSDDDMKTRLTVVTTKKFRTKLESLAKTTGLSLSEIVRNAVDDKISKIEKVNSINEINTFLHDFLNILG